MTSPLDQSPSWAPKAMDNTDLAPVPKEWSLEGSGWVSGFPLEGAPCVTGVCKGSGGPGRVPVPEGSPQTSPLYFAGHFNGAADVPRLQAEVGVEVFAGGNSCGVGGAGCLLHGSLGGPSARLSLCLASPPSGPQPRPPAPAHPTVGGVLLCHPEEGLERSLPP